ncbi:DUF3293 domain-containing protein [Phycicoccus sp. Soil802]|uniref:DUF3293 domain-containing protein n=1 Tax=Phycicoccus sp. Soil802 TaxID=1736414 RepID=UPI000702AE3E|nr:DUF3293 domain-containing protein [Phycicoccus sp. Soil802]KRF29477.1 hypothetical protein ASG91_00110 [Phycicoccus sp. Soil802]
MTWHAYLDAVVCLTTPDGPLRVEPAATAGQVSGPFPAGITHLAVVTAHNPYGVETGSSRNAAAHQQLIEDLDVDKIPHWPAVGADVTFAHTETSLAIPNIKRDHALRLGASLHQDAIFWWTPSQWELLPCDGSPSVIRGWRSAPAATGPACSARLIAFRDDGQRSGATFEVPGSLHLLHLDVRAKGSRFWALDPDDDMEPVALPRPDRWGFLPDHVEPVGMAVALRALTRQLVGKHRATGELPALLPGPTER